MSYPRNAASTEPIAIGAVVQISDGAVQMSGCTVRIKPTGVAEGDGAGTTAYTTDGIVYYTPTQAETNYTSFILIAKKTGCIPVALTVVTSASVTPGTVAVKVWNSVDLGTTNPLPNAAADAAGGLPVSDAGGLDLDAKLANTNEITIDRMGALTDWIDGNRLDLILDARAPSSTALSTAIWTNTLATNLATTNSTVATNLDIAISVIQGQISALNNLSAKANWYGSFLLEVPDSGTRQYIYELVIRDDEDKLTNLDGLPTIALTNAAGTDRSSLITTSVANPSTGRYTITITVGTSTTNESLKLTATGAISAETRYAVMGLQVVDYDNATQVALILTRLGTPSSSIAADIATRASQTSVDDLPTNAELTSALGTGTWATALPWNASWDAEVQSEVQDAIEVNHLDHLLAADYDPAAKPGVSTALLNELIESDAGVSRYTANALEQAPSGGGGSVDVSSFSGTAATTVNSIKSTGETTATTVAALNDALTTQVIHVF